MKSIFGFVLLSLFVFNCAMAYPPEAIYKCAVNMYDHNNKIEFNQVKLIYRDSVGAITFDIPQISNIKAMLQYTPVFGQPLTLTLIDTSPRGQGVLESKTFYKNDSYKLINLELRALALQLKCKSIN